MGKRERVLRLTVHIDGGARGNPGPAGAGIVVRCRDDGVSLREAGFFLGKATNNQAEYSALIRGLEAAAELEADEVEVFSDSELLVRQMSGQYRVKNAVLRSLFDRARKLAERFGRFAVQHVPREQNTEADRLVNQAINLQRDVFE